MTRLAAPAPLGERWLPVRGAPALRDRIALWRAREESFRRHAPFDLEEPGPRPTREERGLSECWFPLDEVLRDVHRALRAWFPLEEVDPAWAERSVLARAGTWVDARRALPSLAGTALPSRLLERLLDRDAAEALAFELQDPVAFGCAPGRYPEVVARIVSLRPARIWDAGTGTGETAHDLGRAVPGAMVVGTTPYPFELLMARRAGRPHDRARTLRYREGVSPCVRFEAGDLLRDEPPGTFDAVLVAGVIGGALSTEREVLAALRRLRASLAPGGALFIANAFRPDVKARAERLVDRLAPCAELRPCGVGEWRS